MKLQFLPGVLMLLCLSAPLVAQDLGADTNNDFRVARQPMETLSTTSAVPEATLPNQQGQVWRQYDIRPYTQRLTNHKNPEQAIIDWILRETGTDLWFREPLGLLHANRNTLSVYHTPATQAVVSRIIDRFILNKSEAQVLGICLATVSSPNWRTKSQHLMRPVKVHTPGAEAWLISKENAALLLADLRKRSDYREHNSPNLIIYNGQTRDISRMSPRSYVRGITPPDNGTSSRKRVGTVNEGYSMQISPLFSTDGRTVDVDIRCRVQQVERFVPLTIETPRNNPGPSRLQIQVPQMSQWSVEERFRWENDKMLMISCGVVATPEGNQPFSLGITNPFSASPARANALIFIECRGTPQQALIKPAKTANSENQQYRGRY
jgi:hypothetical protein